MCDLGMVVKATASKKVKAWRTWNYKWNEASPELTSPVMGADCHTWNGINNKLMGRQYPTKNNFRGFFAFTEAACAKHYRLAGCVLGEVELSGIIVHHEHGYRGQKLKIISLSDSRLAKRYKVKVCRKPR